MPAKKKKNARKEASITRSSAAEYLTFVTAKGEGGVEAVYADEDVWLSQKMMSVLYDVNVRTVNEHLKKVFADNELEEHSVIRKFRITASDGKNYSTNHKPSIMSIFAFFALFVVKSPIHLRLSFELKSSKALGTLAGAPRHAPTLL